MTEEPFGWSELKAIAYAPEMTLDMYKAFPEDASKMIEVVDGYMVKAESAQPSIRASPRTSSSRSAVR